VSGGGLGLWSRRAVAASPFVGEGEFVACAHGDQRSRVASRLDGRQRENSLIRVRMLSFTHQEGKRGRPYLVWWVLVAGAEKLSVGRRRPPSCRTRQVNGRRETAEQASEVSSSVERRSERGSERSHQLLIGDWTVRFFLRRGWPRRSRFCPALIYKKLLEYDYKRYIYILAKYIEKKSERWTSTSTSLRLNSSRAVVPSSTTCFAAAATEGKLRRANKHKMVTRSN
jgi:hypothetical protein